MVPEEPFQVLVWLQMAGDSLQELFKGNCSLCGAGAIPVGKTNLL